MLAIGEPVWRRCGCSLNCSVYFWNYFQIKNLKKSHPWILWHIWSVLQLNKYRNACCAGLPEPGSTSAACRLNGSVGTLSVWLCGHSLSLDFRGLASKMRVRKPDSALSPSWVRFDRNKETKSYLSEYRWVKSFVYYGYCIYYGPSCLNTCLPSAKF